jgi:hypothetical protein
LKILFSYTLTIFITRHEWRIRIWIGCHATMLVLHNLHLTGIVLLILSALIHNLGFGCNWWWTLGSSWYCAGRDFNGYQKIVNKYLLLFNFWISFGFHRGNFWCKLVDWFFCTLPVLNVSWLWMFFGQDWVKLERIGDMCTR